jgi:hypothetical protein
VLAAERATAALHTIYGIGEEVARNKLREIVVSVARLAGRSAGVEDVEQASKMIAEEQERLGNKTVDS